MTDWKARQARELYEELGLDVLADPRDEAGCLECIAAALERAAAAGCESAYLDLRLLNLREAVKHRDAEIERLNAALERAAAQERERCARIAESTPLRVPLETKSEGPANEEWWVNTLREIAAAIRSAPPDRKQKAG